MKKFIGTVNGVEYNDREAFNEAARKAMEENPCLLSITSYEKYEPEPVLPETKKNIVETNDFVIERESEKTVNGEKTEFVIPEGLEEKLRSCDNKEEVGKEIVRKMMDWKRCLDFDRDKLESLENELKVTNSRIETKKKDIDELLAGIEYYEKLLSFTGCTVADCKPCECKKDQWTKNAQEIFGEMGRLFDNFGSNFSSYLRRKGLFD